MTDLAVAVAVHFVDLEQNSTTADLEVCDRVAVLGSLQNYCTGLQKRIRVYTSRKRLGMKRMALVVQRCLQFDRIGARASGCRTIAVEYVAVVVADSTADFVLAYSWAAICCFCLWLWIWCLRKVGLFGI